MRGTHVRLGRVKTAYEMTWSSERTLRVVLGSGISPETSARVGAVHARLVEAGIASLVDVTPAYATVLLTFDPETLDAGASEAAVRGALAGEVLAGEYTAGRVAELAVCYGGEYGPDLLEVAEHHGVSAERVIELHCGAEYRAAFLGFAPGFAYLSGLVRELHTPRRARPRTRVPAGSVGIGGEQTGVYPKESAGGWRIIGRTPRALFDAARAAPALLGIGDRVRFVPISPERFAELGGGGA